MMQQTQSYHPPLPSSSARATYAPCSLPRPSHYKRTLAARAKETQCVIKHTTVFHYGLPHPPAGSRHALPCNHFTTTRPNITQGVVKYSLKLLTLFLLFLLVGFRPAMANNIQIANGQVVQEGANRFIEFDLSWENSWRDGLNWDAAWVFVKYRVPAANGGDDLWKHVWLSTNDGHHNPGSGTGATINIGTTDIAGNPRGMGAFIYRSANGSGTFTTTGTRLRWDVTAQVGHLGFSATAPVEIRVFAIEMVYVAEGAFFVGSGGTESGSFTNGSWTSGAPIPLSITSENALTIGQSAGNLWGTSSSGNNTIGGSGTLPAAYPKGFSAFYMMKYSITQQQYVDFLNTLTYTQQDERINGAPNAAVGTFAHNTNRHGIRIAVSGVSTTTPAVYETTNSFVANNLMSWMDGAAYMDWSGLRPMTELEYEKAARGLANPVANEYAWGTATIFAANRYTLNNAGAANEGIATNYSTSLGNANYSTTRPALSAHQGPMRVGIFAANGLNSGRVTSGASYWGIMELSGNLFERTVTVGNVAGRSFTGLHGNGELNNAGAADVNHWPGINGNSNVSNANQVYGGTTGVTQAAGSGLRGGDWGSIAEGLRVSHRNFATYTFTARNIYYGFRGVRSAPAAGGGG